MLTKSIQRTAILDIAPQKNRLNSWQVFLKCKIKNGKDMKCPSIYHPKFVGSVRLGFTLVHCVGLA